MSKIFAFYGSPGSGKTSIAFKCAMQTYLNTRDTEIIFLSPDIEVLGMGLLFPNYNPDEIFSLSGILDNTTISPDTVLKNLVMIKNMKNFGCLGFKAGETRLSFPEPTEDKITALFDSITKLAGYIFVDCTSDKSDLISRRAMNTADRIVRVISPDVKGMTWLVSNKKNDISDNSFINIVNITSKALYFPVEEICTGISHIDTVLPYSRALAQQFLDGAVSKPLKDNRFLKKLHPIIEELISEEEADE